MTICTAMDLSGLFSGDAISLSFAWVYCWSIGVRGSFEVAIPEKQKGDHGLE